MSILVEGGNVEYHFAGKSAQLGLVRHEKRKGVNEKQVPRCARNDRDFLSEWEDFSLGLAVGTAEGRAFPDNQLHSNVVRESCASASRAALLPCFTVTVFAGPGFVTTRTLAPS
jgi:hypothetical protein